MRYCGRCGHLLDENEICPSCGFDAGASFGKRRASVVIIVLLALLVAIGGALVHTMISARHSQQAAAVTLAEAVKGTSKAETTEKALEEEKQLKKITSSHDGRQLFAATDTTDNRSAYSYLNRDGNVVNAYEAQGLNVTDYIDVSGAETLCFSYTGLRKDGWLNTVDYSGYVSVVAAYDENRKVIESLSLSDFDRSRSDGNVYPSGDVNKGYYAFGECTYILPKGARYVRITVSDIWLKNGLFVYDNGFDYREAYHFQSSLPAQNHLTGKSVITFGDSITSGYLTNGLSFWDFIADANHMQLHNCGENGTGAVGFYQCFRKNLYHMNDYDYVICSGFFNDCKLTQNYTPLGTLTPQGSTAFDLTTFTGALEALIHDYQAGGYHGKLGFILTYHGIKNVQNPDDYNRYLDRATEVFDKYGVPYLDLRDNTEKYYILDRVHPSYDACARLAEDIDDWLNSL